MSDQKAIEKARPIRPGEDIDLLALRSYLKGCVPQIEVEDILQFPKGHSNLTYLLRCAKADYVLRRPPLGAHIPTGHDMEREFKILSALYPRWSKVPRPVHLCVDTTILGAPFYVMERVDGIILRGRQHSRQDLTFEYMHTACQTLVKTLVDIHAQPVDELGLSVLGRPEGYVNRQVAGWSKRYEKAKTERIESIEFVGRWLNENQPKESTPTLIHNDYKYDNLVLNPANPQDAIAVLDWEMCTVGCPLMDLGTTLAYWVDEDDPEAMHMMPFGPTALPGNLTRESLLAEYINRTGRVIENPIFYYAFGLFKVAGIAQQIYARYAKGLTQDARFAIMIEAVKLLGHQAKNAIQKGRISHL